MGEKGGSSPYQRIEYLESNGTQYIDTEEYFTRSTTKVILRYCKFDSKFYIFGTSSTGNTNTVLFRNGGGNGSTYTSSLWRFGNRYITSNETWMTSNEVHELELTTNYKIDGTIRWTPLVSDFTSQHTLFLFANHAADGGVGSIAEMRVYACQISQNDVLVKDFVPVRIGQVGYMYDTVSGQLFGNLGTGDFILGADVND